MNAMKISLGPILYYWDRSDIMRFYDAIALSRVDTVYLGEVVCSRRLGMRQSDWLGLAQDLASHGKEVVLSTLALAETEADLRRMRKIADTDEFLLEANDMSALALVAHKRPFVIGPHLNCYSAQMLDWLVGLGARRWIPSIECTGETVRTIHQQRTQPCEIEMFAFGNAPLSLSSRCFTARHHNVQKDNCEQRCINDPSGISVTTQDGKPFILLNGIQTQTAQVVNLCRQLDQLKEAGVSVLRISPQSLHTPRIADLFANLAQGDISAEEAFGSLSELHAGDATDGFWFGRPGVQGMQEGASADGKTAIETTGGSR